MGQKINPHGFRVGVIKDWDSRWFAEKNKVGDILVEDYRVRKHLKTKLMSAGVARIEIERTRGRIRIHIHCAKPGIVIGKGGSEIEKTRKEIDDMVNAGAEKTDRLAVYINIIEVKQPDLSSQLVAETIAGDLERRISYRRSMKMAIGRTMRLGSLGIKTQVSGRLGGADIARTEHYHEGTIPLQTLRADIDYGFAEANTTFGKIGVKVWIYRGEVLKLQDARDKRAAEEQKAREDRAKGGTGRKPAPNRGPRGGNREEAGTRNVNTKKS